MAVVRVLSVLALAFACALAPRLARAADHAGADVPTSCADLDGAARALLAGPDRTPIAVEWMASPAPMPRAPGADDPGLPADLCFYGSLDDDCRLADPSFPPGPSPGQELSTSRAAVAVDVPSLPRPDAVWRPHARTDAGEARPGFVRDLFRPPRA
jgi:hypothetical protein